MLWWRDNEKGNTKDILLVVEGQSSGDGESIKNNSKARTTGKADLEA